MRRNGSGLPNPSRPAIPLRLGSVATPHHPANQVFVGVLLAGEFAHQILGVLNPVRFGYPSFLDRSLEGIAQNVKVVSGDKSV